MEISEKLDPLSLESVKDLVTFLMHGYGYTDQGQCYMGMYATNKSINENLLILLIPAATHCLSCEL